MIHGGNVFEMESKLGVSRKDILDFSSNINPLGVPEEFKKIVSSSIDELIYYPDINYVALKNSIASFYNIDADFIHVGNGAAQVIFDYIKSINPNKAVIVQPTFSEYERALRGQNNCIINYYLKEKDDFVLDIDSLIRFIRAHNDIQLLVVCNPNNPTGKLVLREELLVLMKYCYSNGIHVLVDEAFMDFADENEVNTLLPLCHTFDNLMVVRAFTKFFGMPGLRLGFGLCKNTKIKREVLDNTIPWSINTFANFFGVYLHKAHQYIEATYQWLKAEKEYFIKELNDIQNIKPYTTEVNFILFKLLNEENAKGLNLKLKDKGIIIRECNSFHGLNEKFVRVAIKNREANHVILQELKKLML